MLKKIVIRNYRLYEDFALEFALGLNILVGDNDMGKSTVLEAVNLALTGRVNGRLLSQELSPYMFNLGVTRRYVQALKEGKNPAPPELVVDLFLDDTAKSVTLAGTNNLTGEDACGLRFRAFYNSDFNDEYTEFIKKPETIRVVPSEYYTCEWLGFSGNPITPRSVPATASMIDASSIKLQSGADYYLQSIISSNLTPSERVELTRAYRSLREGFADNDSIAAINNQLSSSPGDVSDRDLTLGIDISQRASWETSLIPHLDDLPFAFVGKGEQSTLKMLLALNRKVDDAHIILVEEPENHLSFSRMNILIRKVLDKCKDKQVLVTTHSSFVLNKLGLDNLVLVTSTGGIRLSGLTPGTQDYFRKLSGYDTLRLILAREAILVEGPSDELIVQRAYLDVHGVLPIEKGVDVINLRGLSFTRFLEIAAPLGRKTVVVTDNDGQAPEDIAARFASFTASPHISVHVGGAGSDTLEPHLLAANDRLVLNSVFGTAYDGDEALLDYMIRNKSTCALAIFGADTAINMPEYIANAVA